MAGKQSEASVRLCATFIEQNIQWLALFPSIKVLLQHLLGKKLERPKYGILFCRNLTFFEEAQDRARYEQALRLQHDGKLVDAAKMLEQLLHSPSIVNASVRNSPSWLLKYLLYKNLASINHQLGNLTDAQRSFASVCSWKVYLTNPSQALELDSGDVLVWHKLGLLSVKVGDYLVARRAFESALKLNPRHWPSIGQLCEVQDVSTRFTNIITGTLSIG